MTSSKHLFEHHFSLAQIHEVAINHLSPRTARGQDGIDFELFTNQLDENVLLIHTKATTGGYRFTPYKQKLILKGADALPRQISIATLRDRVALRCLNNFLCDIFTDCRPQHAYPVVSRVKKFIAAADSDCAFVKLDIKSFYDEINHDALLACLKKRINYQRALDLAMAAIKNPTGSPRKAALSNGIGVPQGLSISNILSSIYLKAIDDHYSSLLDISYTRYVDDLLLIASKANAENLYLEIRRKLRRTRKLTVHPLGTGKSEILEFGKSVPYLGYTFSPSLTSVRESSIKKVMTSVMRIIYGINDGNTNKALWRLNIRISGCRIQQQDIGWVFYFSQINDHKVLFRMDAQVRTALTRVGRPELISQCKSFMKAFREIAYNRKDSSYFLNFDTIDRESMTRIIILISPRYKDVIDQLTEAKVRSVFLRLMNREVREMERDTLGSFS